MSKRVRLKTLLDEIEQARKGTFWQRELQGFLAMLKEKKYLQLERRIADLLDSNRVKSIKKTHFVQRSADDSF